MLKRAYEILKIKCEVLFIKLLNREVRISSINLTWVSCAEFRFDLLIHKRRIKKTLFLCENGRCMRFVYEQVYIMILY